jgi:hypothetical protein
MNWFDVVGDKVESESAVLSAPIPNVRPQQNQLPRPLLLTPPVAHDHALRVGCRV